MECSTKGAALRKELHNPPPINYWGKFPTQKNFLKQYTYGNIFAISQKELPRLYCVLFSELV